MTTKYHYLYRITCLVTGKFYVGIHSTRNLDDGYLGSGKLIRRSVLKHGAINHQKTILEFYPSRDAVKIAERDMITPQMLLDSQCLNLQPGGGGGFVNEEHGEKARRTAAPRGGKAVHSQGLGMFSADSKLKRDETNRRKYIETGITPWTGRYHSPETKAKISMKNRERQAGTANSQFGTVWINRGGNVKKIQSVELNAYLADSWQRGRTTRKET